LLFPPVDIKIALLHLYHISSQQSICRSIDSAISFSCTLSMPSPNLPAHYTHHPNAPSAFQLPHILSIPIPC
jgi:hypothetical protein